MKLAPIAATVFALISTQAEARRCLNGKVFAPNGSCVTPAELAAMPKPSPAKPDPYANYRSCPGDMMWNGASCAPAQRCPYGMAQVGNSCQSPQRR